MNVIIIGTGNTATILGRKLKLAGHHLLQIFGRDASAASMLAYELDTESTNYWSVVGKDAEVYLIAVSDDAIEDVASHLSVPGKVVAHTAGSVNLEVLKNCSENYGVFYPLQSLHKGVDSLPEISILIEGSNEHTRKILETLALSIATRTASISDEDRRKLHVAAVICNNFTNYLYTLAEDFCKKEKLDFALLYPLILETSKRMLEASPSASQTGPALRHDNHTIEEHLQILERHPELKKIYEFFTHSIQEHFGNKL